jgi:ketosteroid isomerase-like protein
MKRIARKTFATALWAALLSAGALAQGVPSDSLVKQDVSGTWSGSFDMTLPDGSVQHDSAMLLLKQDGIHVTGSAGPAQDKQLQIKDGRATGGDVQFSVEAQGGMPMTFQLHLEGDRLRGDARGKIPDGEIKAKVDVLRLNGQVSQAPPRSAALFREISDLDSVLFGAFNRRDLETLKTLFNEDLEAYHDKGGLTRYQENIDSFKRTFESSTWVRRELVDGTLEVYPIEGYGAVEIGVHRFYSTNPGQKEELTATAKFVHVWQKKNGKWKISRVVSYDHR